MVVTFTLNIASCISRRQGCLEWITGSAKHLTALFFSHILRKALGANRGYSISPDAPLEEYATIAWCCSGSSRISSSGSFRPTRSRPFALAETNKAVLEVVQAALHLLHMTMLMTF